MIDPQERKALADAIEGFDTAYMNLMQAANRILRILEMEAGEKPAYPAVARPEPAVTPVLFSGKIDPTPIAKMKAMAFGFTGDPCQQCGMFTLRRTGLCTTCSSCGWNSGCS